MIHPGITVFPAVAGLTEQLDLPAEIMRPAVVAGYEVGLRIGALLGKEHYATCQTTATAGCFAAAAAASRALGLDAERTLWAFGHAGTQAAGLWQFLDDGAEAAKAFHPAMATRSGISAALLAKEGIPGATRVLEGPRGMLRAWKIDADATHLIGVGEEPPRLLETTIKCWPACGQMHTSLDCVRDILEETPLKAADIAAVLVEGPQPQIAVADRRNPAGFAEAKFSTRFCVAFLICEGSLTFSNFGPDAVKRIDVRNLAQRIEVREDPAFTARFPAEGPARVTIELNNGQLLKTERSHRRGDPQAPLTFDQLVSRFESIAAATSVAVRENIITQAAAFAWAEGNQGDAVRSLMRSIAPREGEQRP